MAIYRVYRVHDDGDEEAGEAFYAAHDDEAVRRLSPTGLDDVRAELWQGGRFIAVARTPATRRDDRVSLRP